MTLWTLSYDGFDPDHEGLREALCTLGNGYFATRGALELVVADAVHYPGSYLAGCYNRLASETAGRRVENESLVNVPNWLPVRLRVAGEGWLTPATAEVLEDHQELDIQCGVLTRSLRLRDAAGRVTRVSSRRLVHMARPHLAASQTTVTAENWAGTLELASALDGTVRNCGVPRYRGLSNRHLIPTMAEALEDGVLLLRVRTSQSQIRIAQSARHVLQRGDGRTIAGCDLVTRNGYAAEGFRLELRAGELVTLEKIIAMYCSRDYAISAPETQAVRAVRRSPDFKALLEEQRRAWGQLWRRFDLEISTRQHGARVPATLLLRLHGFHLLQVASSNNLHVDAGIPARGLHGEAYRGHVFWDELFIFPALTFRMPEITRSLLMYRWYRLGEARAAARAAGYRGAMYPWQSGSDGREETQTLHLNPRSGRWLPDHSHRQRHVNAAIAYNIWQYYQVTADQEFLAFYGAEMLLEIARFWASIAEHNPASARYEIRGVMGPDEYHDGYPDREAGGIDNNAYTNVMASWCLRTALAALEELTEERRGELVDCLGLEEAELARWERCSRLLRVDFHDGHIISQFQGYDRLQEFDWEGYRQRYGRIDRLDRILEAEGDTPNRYKLSKQADVLMLFYLFSSRQLSGLFEHLGYEFQPQWILDNIEYYRKRTSHGSTLSRVVHAWVLSRSDRAGSWDLFNEALRSDYEDIQGGTTREGIHLGAMAGTIDLAFRCYTGLELHQGMLWLNPCLPDDLERLHVRLSYRGRPVDLEIFDGNLSIEVADHGREGLTIGVDETVYEIAPDHPRVIRLESVPPP